MILAVISWLALSNHCALGLALVENHGNEEASAHDCCASTIPSHPEPARQSSTPCCKTLRIVSVAPAEAPAWNAICLPGASDDLLAILAKPPAFSGASYLFVDTGPPEVATFAEIVLQRSLLAHAPPSLS